MEVISVKMQPYENIQGLAKHCNASIELFIEKEVCTCVPGEAAFDKTSLLRFNNMIRFMYLHE